jgi:cytoskeletal protein CcmA (bactofilin family)
MFKKRDDTPTSSYAPAPVPARRNGGSSGHGFSVLGADVVVTGNVRATSDLHVEGRVEGDLDCGNLVIGPEASVRGQVRAESARIAGTVEGGVAIRQLTVEAGARILGDVEYENISIENGAHIDGRLKHGALATAAAVTPALGAPKEFKMFDAPAEAAEEAA